MDRADVPGLARAVAAVTAPRPRVMFLVTEDWYFCSHRLALARALAADGFDVAVACRVDRHGATITDAGLALYPLALCLILVGCFTKSAQWPFHFWLPNAMAAPESAAT